jgi:hypothetical protein
LESVSVACQAGGGLTGPNPTDRGKPASTYHLLVDRRGIPLAACLSAANTHDAMLLEQVVDAVAPVKGPRGRPGRPRKRPAKRAAKAAIARSRPQDLCTNRQVQASINS